MKKQEVLILLKNIIDKKTAGAVNFGEIAREKEIARVLKNLLESTDQKHVSYALKIIERYSRFNSKTNELSVKNVPLQEYAIMKEMEKDVTKDLFGDMLSFFEGRNNTNKKVKEEKGANIFDILENEFFNTKNINNDEQEMER